MKATLAQITGLSLAALIAGGVVIGLSPIFVRLSELGPVATAFWRVALTVLPLLAWQRMNADARTDAEPVTTLRDAAALSLPGLMLAGDLVAWHLSIHLTSVANATLLANMAPVFVVLAGWLIFGSTVTGGFLMGLALSVIGVAILSRGAGPVGDASFGGDILALVAAAFYAGYILALSRLRSRFSTLTTLLWSSGSAAICILPVALIPETSIWPATINGWAIVSALALLCHLGGQGLIIYALAALPASFSSLTLLIQPVVAALVAWFLLNEPLGVVQALGGVVVITGILLASRNAAGPPGSS